MKMNLKSLLAVGISAVVLIATTSSAQTSTTGGTTTAPTKKTSKKAAAAGVTANGRSRASTLLADAYATLEHADADYHGHRVRAMRQIKDAAKELGEPLHGDGHAREAQSKSDGELHTAEGLLQEAKSGIAKKKVLEHINAALAQLNTALKIR